MNGVVRAITLDVSIEREALAELALFERDPAGYKTKKQSAAEASAKTAKKGVALDVPNFEAFIRHVKNEGLTDNYRRYVLTPYLTAWGVALAERQLRDVTLTELYEILDRWSTARTARIIALKAFTKWLRERDMLRLAEDPTAELKVPPSKAEKSVRPKGYVLAAVEQAYAEANSQRLRDTLRIRATTGMHATEIDRVARGDGILTEVNDPCGIKGTVTFRQLKADMTHTISLDSETFAAFQRCQIVGRGLGDSGVVQMLRRIADRLRSKCTNEEERRSIVPLHPSQLRHSFSTWARTNGELVRPTGRGLPIEEVAAVMGHTNIKTTKKFYLTERVPPMIRLPLRLVHPADPSAESAAARKAASND
ncbi:site-specific integrase [Myxococcus llanfairpwllgwyngyllgogerychwyrndrobwllllantysiliogogogochensis]|uniref:site-specific integrase n=1 Tax=Myxococcus llanfairpwllgwyngyllgogerychwyrndrobwllllantysiliogogogochensis TaxID=2590453 RepID=UPI001FE6DE54|nr:site-specific integrase [Myxococcus llanfairpwllgwyngyllgogerychwyrndrobwllllantysiliogogogochensis]